MAERKEGSNEPRAVAGDPGRTRRWRWRCDVTTTAVAGSSSLGRERLRNEAGGGGGIYGALCLGWLLAASAKATRIASSSREKRASVPTPPWIISAARFTPSMTCQTQNDFCWSYPAGWPRIDQLRPSRTAVRARWTGSSVINADDQILLSLVEQLAPEHTDKTAFGGGEERTKQANDASPSQAAAEPSARPYMPGRELAGAADRWG
jgi:hypothetical protein